MVPGSPQGPPFPITDVPWLSGLTVRSATPHGCLSPAGGLTLAQPADIGLGTLFRVLLSVSIQLHCLPSLNA
jgi:hypothetical protein